MTKKEIIEFLSEYPDDQEFNICKYDDDLITHTNTQIEAFKVYKEIIEAIADYQTADWVHICENVNDLDYIGSLGYVEVIPEIVKGKICYKISENETTKNSKLYSGLFTPEDGYWCHQVTSFEDCYSGQMLLPFGPNNKMLCVEYSC